MGDTDMGDTNIRGNDINGLFEMMRTLSLQIDFL
jgi:hypothetical protein